MQESFDQPPPYSAIQPSYPVNMHTQPANNLAQVHASTIPTQNQFYPRRFQPINTSMQVQAFPNMSNIQMTQEIMNPQKN